jgi:predicted acyltransferase
MSTMSREAWLDVFRGAAVAGMLLVNHPGSWATVYWPLVHADWNGVRPADFVFPMFLFAVGLSLNYSSLSPWQGKGYGALPYAKILRRAAFLLILGLLLNGFPTFDLASLRLTGVLQRIAICYLFAALVFLHARLVTQICLITGMLALYHVLMMVVPVPGCGAGSLTRECNLAGHIDRLLLGQRLPVGSHDPEGLLSTLPSLATTLFGSLAGQMLRSAQPRSSKVILLSAAGLAGVLTALAWHQVFPINKNLWSPSFVLLTAGVSSLIVAILFAFSRSPFLRWAAPVRFLGETAIVAYVTAEAGGRLLAVTGAQQRIYEWAFTSWFEPFQASLLFALTYSLLVLMIVSAVHHLAVARPRENALTPRNRS